MERHRGWLLAGAAMAAILGAACSGGDAAGPPNGRTTTSGAPRTTAAMPSAPRASLPTVDLATLPEPVAARYHFAEANRAAMERIPCYCGCGALGHRSLYDCFIGAQGGYDAHGAGCGICQAEAIDVERMMNEGKSIAEIRATIDAQYASAGPGTNTPKP